MAEFMAPRGLIIELITPLEGGGRIDPKGLERLLAHVSPFAQGVFLASPEAGEGGLLTTALRLELLKGATAFLKSRSIPIFVWVTQDTEERTRDAVGAIGQWVKTCPYEGGIFLVDTPLFYHSNRGLPDLYREISPIAEAPLILHNHPDLIQRLAAPFKRNNIRTAILKELTAFKEISGIIFSGSLDRAHHYQRACRQRADFRIYDGDETRFLDHPSRSGVVSMGANLVPAAWDRIVGSSLQATTGRADYPDRLQQLWETGRTLRRLRDLYAEAPAIMIKDLLAEMGIVERPTHASKNTDEVRMALRELVSQLG